MSGLLGGVLPKIFEAGNRARRYKNALLQDPRGTINALAESLAVDINEQMAAPQWRNSLLGRPFDREAMRREQARLADTLPMGALGAIKVFHGSPHTFTKADSSKIGTGEGAQAYGHGLYWAENPEVAKQYATTLSQADQMTPRGLAARFLTDADGDVLRARSALYDAWSKAKKPFDVQYQRALDELNKGVGSANLYEANLRWPDAAREATDPLGPQHFLDWDKPLAEQPAGFDAAMRAIGFKPAPFPYSGYMGTADKTLLTGGGGEAAWRAVVKQAGSPEAASAAFRQAGIPGIAYLDGGSRGAGTGTRNYVTFDDALVDLLLRNGIPLK